MSHVKIRKLVLAALFAALCTVMTLVIQIPSPMQGYVNLGDCAVLLSAWVLGPVYGGVAAGTGSMLADLFSGYAHYAPGTFLIKLCMAVAAWRRLSWWQDTSAIPACGWARVWLLPLLSRATSYKAPLASSRPLRFMSF